MSGELSWQSAQREVERVVYATCLALDASEYNAFLDHTSADFRYRITAYSPEIRKQMTWLDHDRRGLSALFELLPKHHVNHAVWFRHAVVYQTKVEAPDRLQAVTSLAVYHTHVDVGDVHVEAGSSKLFVVGRYHDSLRQVDGSWLLQERNVRLETRQLGIGTHLIV